MFSLLYQEKYTEHLEHLAIKSGELYYSSNSFHFVFHIYAFQDTEFPGVVARPIGEFRSNADYQYQLLRCNVDLLKIIQLGLTFMNEQGEYPPGTSTWQFNFKFNLT